MVCKFFAILTFYFGDPYWRFVLAGELGEIRPLIFVVVPSAFLVGQFHHVIAIMREG